MYYTQFMALTIAAARRRNRDLRDLFGLTFVGSRGDADSVKKQFAAYEDD